MTMWTVYDHPTDYPHCYVARKFLVDAEGPQPTEDFMVSPRLEWVRTALEMKGLVRLGRTEEDDPKIVETWL